MQSITEKKYYDKQLLSNLARDLFDENKRFMDYIDLYNNMVFNHKSDLNGGIV